MIVSNIKTESVLRSVLNTMIKMNALKRVLPTLTGIACQIVTTAKIRTVLINEWNTIRMDIVSSRAKWTTKAIVNMSASSKTKTLENAWNVAGFTMRTMCVSSIAKKI